jgi:hypothetical protein
VVSFLPVYPPTPYTPPSPPPYVPHARPISFFSILSPAQYWVSSHKHTPITLNSYCFSTATMVTGTHNICTAQYTAYVVMWPTSKSRYVSQSDRFGFLSIKHILRRLLCSHAFQYISIPPVVYSSSYDLLGRNSLVDIATCYGMDGPRIESRWGGARFSAPWGPTIHLYNWYWLFPGGKAARAWR